MGLLAGSLNQVADAVTGGVQPAPAAPAAPAPVKLDDYYTKNPGTASASQQAPVIGGEATATGYDASAGSVDPSQTASALLNKETSLDSPSMQRAGRQGMLSAASRGLQNTSIAAGAAQGEMVDRAAPIALSDARTYADQNIENQRAINKAEEISTGRATDVDVGNVDRALQADVSTMEEAGKTERFNTDAQNDMTKTVVDANASINQTGLAGDVDLAGRYMQSMTTLSVSDKQAQSSIETGMIDALARLASNPDLPKDRMDTFKNEVGQIFAGSATFMSSFDALFPEEGTVQNAAETPLAQAPPIDTRTSTSGNAFNVE